VRIPSAIRQSLDGVIANVPASRVRFGTRGPDDAGRKIVKPWPNDVSQITKKKVRVVRRQPTFLLACSQQQGSVLNISSRCGLHTTAAMMTDVERSKRLRSIRHIGQEDMI